VDDVAFTLTALKMIQATVNIDATRVYAMGISNGGMLTERLGCEAPLNFAGLASNAGGVVLSTGGEAGQEVCDRVFGSKHVNYIHFHGTADATVPWTGITTSPNMTFPGTLEDTVRWVTRMGCDASVQSTFNDGTFSNIRWPQCRAGTVVELMTVRGGTHSWWTRANGGFSTAAYILNFFTQSYYDMKQKITANAE